MTFDLINSLYVFMLAGFIGFEVIRRVSPLLHTPLMSLTNALDAIAVVGAIVIAGEAQEHARDSARNHRHCRRDQQRGGRIFDYRPHVEDVQSQPSPKNHEPYGHCNISLNFAIWSPRRFLSLSLKWMSAPSTARRGVWAGELGMVLAIGGTLLHHGIVDYRWIADRARAGHDHWSPARPGADDRRAAADRPQPRFWRAAA